MQATVFPASQGLCRFQSTLRPSCQCQCSTSFAAPSRPSGLSRSGVTVHSSSSGSSTTGSSSEQPAQAVIAQAEALQQQQPSWQQQQRKSKGKGQPKQPGKEWDYKYKWQTCPSVCAAGDDRCYKVEALIQNVLSYPYMPPKICRYLPGLSADLNSMTALVEQMASHFGKELTLLYIAKWPLILELDFSTLLQVRVVHARMPIGCGATAMQQTRSCWAEAFSLFG